MMTHTTILRALSVVLVLSLASARAELVSGRTGGVIDPTGVKWMPVAAPSAEAPITFYSAMCPQDAAVDAEPVREFPEDYRARHSLGVSSTVHTALKAAVEKGVVESEPDGYFIGDPFFARYVRT